jgi:putative ABC transport system permease protein
MPLAFRHALRSLKRTPVFSITAIITLVLGIGAATAMFAIVQGVLLAPLPYGHPDRLVDVSMDLRSDGLRSIRQPLGAYYTYKRFGRRIDDIAFYRTGSANIYEDAGSSGAERVTATWITASTIALLQVSPLIGRPFSDDEDSGRGPDAAIISEAMWRTRFHGSRDVLGKTLVANSVRRKIVGVMPERFQFPTPETRVWLPAKLDRDLSNAGDFSYSSVARLSDGVTPGEAQRALASVLPRMAELFPRMESGQSTSGWLDQTRPTPAVVPLRDEITADIARTLWILAAAAALVLLVACANVANLMLIRADGRQLELALREALGASRLRILTHFAGESAMLAATAGVVALAGAWAAIRALVAFGPTDIPRLDELHVGMVTVGFTVLVVALTAIACSAIPAFRIRRSSLTFSLRDGGRNETAGRARQRLRGLIATLQIAVALVVLAGSALLVRTFHLLYKERPGFDAQNVVTLWIQLPFARYGADSSAVNYFARLTSSVAGLPGVRAAGVTTLLPLGEGERRQRSFVVEGDGQTVAVPTYTVDDGYLATMSIPLLAGHGFDRLGVQRDGEIIISRRAAIALWKDPSGMSAIGKRLRAAPAGPSYTVVGVAGDVRDRDLATPPAPTVYLPQALPIDPMLEPAARRNMALVVKSSLPPASVIGPVRQIVRELDQTVATYDERPMSDVVRASTARLSFTLALMSTAAVITLVLGAIGLYGVMAYTVALRTRELGVRVALGADPRRLARTVAMRGLRLIAGGVGAGLLLFTIAAQFLRTFLYGVTAGDPLTLAGTTLAIVAIASIANWVPARRAAQVDPAAALRAD